MERSMEPTCRLYLWVFETDVAREGGLPRDVFHKVIAAVAKLMSAPKDVRRMDRSTIARIHFL